MDVYVFVEFDLGYQGYLCDQFVVGVQGVVFVDDVVGVDDVVFIDDVVCVDGDEWVDVGVGGYLCIWIDDCVGVDVWWMGWCDVEQCGDFGEGCVWVFGYQCGVGCGFGIFGVQYYDVGLVVGQLGVVVWVGQEGQLVGVGMGKGGYVMDGGVVIIVDLQVKLFGELLGGIGRSIYVGSLLCVVILVMFGFFWV